MELIALQGDITTLAVDAVVNAANRDLQGGGGVDGAIHAAAGASILLAATKLLAPCEPGEAVLTGGFALSAKWIIHTVGPVWRGGFSGEADILANCYKSCLQIADEMQVKSIAFPAISSGAHGFPKSNAAAVAVRTLRNIETNVDSIQLVAHDEDMLRIYQALL